MPLQPKLYLPQPVIAVRREEGAPLCEGPRALYGAGWSGNLFFLENEITFIAYAGELNYFGEMRQA